MERGRGPDAPDGSRAVGRITLVGTSAVEVRRIRPPGFGPILRKYGGSVSTEVLMFRTRIDIEHKRSPEYLAVRRERTSLKRAAQRRDGTRVHRFRISFLLRGFTR